MGKKKRKQKRVGEPAGYDCETCGGKCCRYFALEIDEPEDFEDYDSIRWYLFHEHTYVFVEDGDWYLCVTTPCEHLTDDFRCGIYDRRPIICRKHSNDGCEYEDENEWDYEQRFDTAEQLEAHMLETLGKKCFEKAYRKKGKKGKG
ncbi:MAG: YkgJ family cysteine cluster protein [Planctomycetota bacterium]